MFPRQTLTIAYPAVQGFNLIASFLPAIVAIPSLLLKLQRDALLRRYALTAKNESL